MQYNTDKTTGSRNTKLGFSAILIVGIVAVAVLGVVIFSSMNLMDKNYLTNQEQSQGTDKSQDQKPNENYPDSGTGGQTTIVSIEKEIDAAVLEDTSADINSIKNDASGL